MIKAITDFFVKYATDTSSGRMFIHVLMLVIAVTWIGLITLITLNFPVLMNIYDRQTSTRKVAVENALTVSTQVNALIMDQRGRLGVDRLYVSRFHNGKVDLNGVHFIYFSRVSESDGPGISNEMTQTQNLPLSIFPEMLSPLAKKQCYYIETVDSAVENSSFLSEMGTISMMTCPIFNLEGKLIGIIGAEGVRNKINSQDSPHLHASLQTLATVLGGLLIIR